MISKNLILPDLGFADQRIVVSLWLVPRGSVVAQGEAVVEVLCGDATVDLPSPVDGILVEQLVEEDKTVVTGQCLGVIEERG